MGAKVLMVGLLWNWVIGWCALRSLVLQFFDSIFSVLFVFWFLQPIEEDVVAQYQSQAQANQSKNVEANEPNNVGGIWISNLLGSTHAIPWNLFLPWWEDF